MLEVLLTQDFKGEDLFCEVPSCSELSLFFSAQLSFWLGV